jgi:hypothetical protein
LRRWPWHSELHGQGPKVRLPGRIVDEADEEDPIAWAKGTSVDMAIQAVAYLAMLGGAVCARPRCTDTSPKCRTGIGYVSDTSIPRYFTDTSIEEVSEN